MPGNVTGPPSLHCILDTGKVIESLFTLLACLRVGDGPGCCLYLGVELWQERRCIRRFVHQLGHVGNNDSTLPLACGGTLAEASVQQWGNDCERIGLHGGDKSCCRQLVQAIRGLRHICIGCNQLGNELLDVHIIDGVAEFCQQLPGLVTNFRADLGHQCSDHWDQVRHAMSTNLLWGIVNHSLQHIKACNNRGGLFLGINGLA
mmetsp:Transcript_992/g.6207  ORF Transcript_992/g.6207 Transcript_992/m.6207 type:complete len:204 (+) Transcript_992:2245-2856(+)